MDNDIQVAVLGAGSTMGLAMARNLARSGTMLADADAVIGALEPALERPSSDVVWPQMSTIGEAATIRRRLAEGAKEHGDEDFSATYWTSAPMNADRA